MNFKDMINARKLILSMATTPLLLAALPNLNAVAAVSQPEVSSQLVSDFAPNLGEKLEKLNLNSSLLAKALFDETITTFLEKHSNP